MDSMDSDTFLRTYAAIATLVIIVLGTAARLSLNHRPRKKKQ